MGDVDARSDLTAFQVDGEGRTVASDAKRVVLASVSCQLKFPKDEVVPFVAFQGEPLRPHVAQVIG